MDIARHIISRRGLAASIRVAVIAGAVSVEGCSRLCMIGASPAEANAANAQNGRASASNHRPPGGFGDRAGPEPEDVPPQIVNVFGEVNGHTPRVGTVTGEMAFQQHTFADEGFDENVTVDPSGKWLVFSSTRNSEHPSIYMQRVDGTTVTQLTDGGSDDAYPVFSPDAKRIAFCSTRAGTWQIFSMDVDGRNITQLTNGLMQAIHPTFSPDGSRIAYCALGARSGQWELWTLDLKSNEKRMIGYGLFPSWSPRRTGDQIAFQRARQRGSRWFSLWTIDLVDGEARRATEIAASANAAILSPTWSPDAKRLAFTTVIQPGKGGENRPRGQTDIWTIDADGSNRQRLTDGHGNNLTPFWAVNNRVFFVSDRGGAESVWSVRADLSADAMVQAPADPKAENKAVGSADAGDAAPN